ncbi:AbrB family transcriptional regulator [Chelativorans sp. YIM 93263]|uniref:AbrB family transcriptional regulator n=1 Tax=Chelativorans sp. YIM 93263 TaxID=2906648 RepID=UPI002378E69D|nr:AbrB family transcriptional regulator [Chelativorans sp. YIM 93263]
MQNLLFLSRTIIIGALGGLIGYLLGLPLGWLLGAMLATVPLAVAGFEMRSSWRLRSVMVAVIGVMVGGAFTPDIVAQASRWVYSLIGIAIYGVVITFVGIGFCRYVARQGRLTAAFAATPGGLSEMLVIGPSLGADVRFLSLVHGMRVMIILMTVPAVVTLVGLGPGEAIEVDRSLDLSLAMPLQDAVILLGCVIFGIIGGRLLRLPAADLSGPLLLSAVAHLAEWTTFHPPQLIVIAAQVVIGVSIAKFFADITWRQLFGGLVLGGGLTVTTLTLAALFAYGFERFLGIPFSMAYLALVPGGLPEMSLVSVSLGIDPAFVSVHHLFRIVLVLTLAPILIPLWAREEITPVEE